MNTHLPSGLDPDHFASMGAGFMSAKMLCVASELGLFEQLADGPRTLDELSADLGVPRHALRVIVNGMVALDVLDCAEGRYSNRAEAAAFLTSQGALDMRAGLRLYDRIVYPMWMQLESIVRSGSPARHGQPSEEFARVFSEGVEAWTAAGALALAERYDFSAHRRVLDLAGGTGSYLVPMLKRHPSLEATLYDLPPSVEQAGRRLAREGLADRVALIDGDAFFDPLPGGHDVVLIAGFVHLFDADKTLLVLRRLREVVEKGTRLLMVDQWMDEAHSRPVFAAMLAGTYLMLSGQGGTYSVSEVQSWLGETGWRFSAHRPLAGVTSLILAEAS